MAEAELRHFMAPSEEGDAFVVLLRRASAGDRHAENELLRSVYDDLRAIAERLFRRERRGHTLQPTVVVNDALVRLLRAKNVQWSDKTQFYRFAARNMRQVLIDYAKYHRSRTAPGQRFFIDDVAEVLGTGEPIDVEGLDGVLRTLEGVSTLSQRQVQGVVLRVYSGLTDHEVAEVLELSETQAKNDWRFSKALIRDRVLRDTKE